jgi:hypothetical protein
VTRTTLLLIASGLALAGCASITPPAPPATPTTTATAVTSAVAHAETTHEYTSQPPLPQRTTVSAPTAAAAIRTFAIAYINWTASSVTADMRTLAAASIGQARSAMQLTAANTAHDYELRRGGVANTGTVEAIAPRLGTRNQYVVVTREQTTATKTDAYQGLRPAWHLTIATVQQVSPGAWVLSGWQPEN